MTMPRPKNPLAPADNNSPLFGFRLDGETYAEFTALLEAMNRTRKARRLAAHTKSSLARAMIAYCLTHPDALDTAPKKVFDLPPEVATRETLYRAQQTGHVDAVKDLHRRLELCMVKHAKDPKARITPPRLGDAVARSNEERRVLHAFYYDGKLPPVGADDLIARLGAYIAALEIEG